MLDFKLNYGTKPTTVAMTTIDVVIDPNIMIGDYASAYANELHRLNPVRAKELSLSKEELFDYFSALLAIRVSGINGTLRDWRTVNLLAIPAWIQHTIAQVGNVVDRDRGLRIVPKFDMKYELVTLLETSEKLLSFQSDGLSLHQNAFPRGVEGNEEVMGMVILNDYVHSIKLDAHPASSYVAAFLGAKLAQEQQFSVLYRVRYDDVNFIATQLLNDRTLRQ